MRREWLKSMEGCGLDLRVEDGDLTVQLVSEEPLSRGQMLILCGSAVAAVYTVLVDVAGKAIPVPDPRVQLGGLCRNVYTELERIMVGSPRGEGTPQPKPGS